MLRPAPGEIIEQHHPHKLALLHRKLVKVQRIVFTAVNVEVFPLFRAEARQHLSRRDLADHLDMQRRPVMRGSVVRKARVVAHDPPIVRELLWGEVVSHDVLANPVNVHLLAPGEHVAKHSGRDLDVKLVPSKKPHDPPIRYYFLVWSGVRELLRAQLPHLFHGGKLLGRERVGDGAEARLAVRGVGARALLAAHEAGQVLVRHELGRLRA
mmetsp:Transcript_5503/g.15576  ORF Transcript_5503/g.15576 Transcript_5503/m.15576 type:complete len:211 (-) Transcript_5503:244-876(-)